MNYKEKYLECKSKLFIISYHIESTLQALNQSMERVAKLERIIESLPEEIKEEIFVSEYPVYKAKRN